MAVLSDHRAVRPAEAIALGDPALLRMGMSEAAQHFGIAVPISQRDRKSGARKRKQYDIEMTPDSGEALSA
jgi:DNA (cytosine-5)-methyltransferase 1